MEKQTMSQDMLGPLARALVGVPKNRLPLILDIANRFGDEKQGGAWHGHLSKTVRAGLPASADASVQVSAPKPSLKLLKSVSLPAFAEKKTSECLVGSHFGYRDPNIDSWLPETQSATPASKVGVYGRTKEQTFADMFRVALALAPDAPLETVELLKECGHIVALQQLDVLIDKQESGEDVGLRTDGYANFAPVLGKDGKVCVVDVSRDDGGWSRFVLRLRFGLVWNREDRLVLSNSDTVTL